VSHHPLITPSGKVPRRVGALGGAPFDKRRLRGRYVETSDGRRHSAATPPPFQGVLLFGRGGIAQRAPGGVANQSAFTCFQGSRVMLAAVSALVFRITAQMHSELARLAVASTAVTDFIWLLSALAPRCLPEHVGYLIRFAAC
jgi:hypothetical protein